MLLQKPALRRQFSRGMGGTERAHLITRYVTLQNRVITTVTPNYDQHTDHLVPRSSLRALRPRCHHCLMHVTAYRTAFFSAVFSPGDLANSALNSPFHHWAHMYGFINQKPKDFEPPAERHQTTKKPRYFPSSFEIPPVIVSYPS